MKKNTILAVITLTALVILVSCGGGGGETKEAAAEEKKTETPPPPPEKTGLEAQLELGKSIYDTKCVVCHQADGKGIKGAFPPLANSDYLLADPVRGVAQTLNGSNEEMIVNGEKYNAPMTPQVETKEEAVAVINYVLKHFNGYTEEQMLTMDDVKDVEINPMQTVPPAE
jgi:nitrite reductase (NO-forming)